MIDRQHFTYDAAGWDDVVAVLVTVAFAGAAIGAMAIRVYA